MRKLLGFLTVALLAFPLTRAMAWSSGGHQVVAAAAFRELSPELKTKVSEILKAHPEYERWKRYYRTDNNSLDLEAYIFLRASVWPDEIRQRDNPYHHPHWHYLDYPLKPRGFPFEPGRRIPDDNALFAIAKAEHELSSRGTSAQDRAIYLSWLIHLIGDIHQPLHCASLVDSTYPKGDRGGNDFFIKPEDREISLCTVFGTACWARRGRRKRIGTTPWPLMPNIHENLSRNCAPTKPLRIGASKGARSRLTRRICAEI